jgi:hypothetical protein
MRKYFYVVLGLIGMLILTPSFSKAVKGITGHHDVFVKQPEGNKGV